ncbi:MAG: hypothetical protein HQ581_12995, partial [Planctomycetes bacterium]|nr:hypothetical protein [Planctomycetota bacterium]
MRVTCCWLTLGAMVVCSPALGAEQTSADKPRAAAPDTRLVSSDFVAAMVIRPKQIAETPLAAPVLRDRAFQRQLAQVKEFGIDPLGIKELTVLLPRPGSSDDNATAIALVVRMAEPVDGKALTTRIRNIIFVPPEQADDPLLEVEHAGKTYYKMTKDNPGAVFQADDRTLLVAVESLTRHLIGGKAKPGKLAKQLAGAEPGADVIVSVVFDLLPADTVNEMVADIEQRGVKPLRKYSGTLTRVDCATVSLSLDDDPMLKLVVTGKDEATAEELLAQAPEGIAAWKTFLAQAKNDIPEENRPWAASVNKLMEEMLADYSLKRRGRRVVLTVKRPDSLAKVVPVLLQVFRDE